MSDWDRRELCPDGSCTGLIGPEGTCKVCGRAAPNWGDERKRGTLDEPDDGDEDDDEGEENEVPADPIQPAAKVALGGGEWSARTLCSDGACVGVIGANGTCKVCGKPAAAGAAVAVAAADNDDEYEDDNDDDEYEDDEAEDELAAAADELAGVASSTEVESAKELAQAADRGGEDDEANRKLCPDGACIGVIGDDGKCKICRREAA